MILTIDCGNTHTTVGCMDDTNAAVLVFRIPTDRRETEFGYAAKIKQILDLHGIAPADMEGAVISCVVPSVTDTLVRAVRLMTGLDALVVGAGVKTGLHLCINDPGTVASDLVVAAVAAKEEYPLPCLIVDMGTATTVTAVDEKARFIGCAIYPGAEISLNALAEKTALLPHIEICPPKNAIAASTVDCMKSGIVYGTAGAVDGLLDRFAESMGTPPASIVATGGLAHLIAPHCRHSMTVDETLLLRGLKTLWEKNRTRK
ncbi:MAG: type III pantothenate kinase [Clostridia bacterium]|nr:type III pantothenate kinase [Clostridia bacterium]